MPYVDLGPVPSNDKPAQDAGLVDLGPAPAEPTLDDILSRWSQGMSGTGKVKIPTKYAKQAIGALARDSMRLGETAAAIPENAVRLAKTILEIGKSAQKSGDIGNWGPAGTYAAAERVRKDPVAAARIEGGLTAELKRITDMHRRGQQAILAAHPEWESDPPENFVDLLTSPRKLSLAVLESTPRLIAAGIITAAGAPHLSVSMMFASEFQDMKNQALADGRTEQEAQAAGLLYAPIAAAIEQMQLQGIFNIAKGMHKPLIGLVAKKMAAKGLKTVKYPIIKTMVNEAIEEMAQGSWQEASAKLVYDKSVPEGLRGFIDRRAQEGLIGATMGVVPGLGGKAIRKATRGIAPVTEAKKAGIVQKAGEAPSPIIEEGADGKMPPLIVEAPITADQAIGQQYGLTNEQTNERLSDAEQRYRELKYMNTEKMTNTEKQELAFLRRNRNNIEALLDRETQPIAPKIKKRSKETLRAIGHKIQREAEISIEDYRDLAELTTGKRSMKNMSKKEMDSFVSALEDAYGSPKEILPEDYETRILVHGKETTMQAVTRDAIEVANNLPGYGRKARRLLKKGLKVIKKGYGRKSAFRRTGDLAYGISNTPVYHLARILDGGKDGIFSEVLDKNIEAGGRVKRAHSRKSTEMLEAGLEAAGITTKDLAEMSQVVNPRLKLDQWIRPEARTNLENVDINGQLFELSLGDILNLYMVSSQEDGMRHLLGGGEVIEGVPTGKLTEEFIADLRQQVESNPKALAVTEIMANIRDTHWVPTINAVSNKLEGRDIATNPNWWGLSPHNPRKVPGKEQPKPTRVHRVNILENKSILKDRVKSSIPLVMRDVFAEFSVFSDAIAEYVGYADATRTSRTLLNNPDIINILEQKGYGQVVDNIKTIQERAQSIPARPGTFTRFLTRRLPNLYKAVLVANSRVVIGQATSVLNYPAYVSPQYLDGIKDMFSWEENKLTMELSDFAWDRFHMNHSSMMLGKISESDAALRQWTGRGSDANKMAVGMKTTDLSALTAGRKSAEAEYQAALKGPITGLSAEWWADKTDLPKADVEMYKRVQEQGENADPAEVEAVKIWKDIVVERSEYLWQRTQPSWDKFNRSTLTSEHEARGIFVLFRSFHEKSLTIFNEAKLDYSVSDKTIDDKARFVQRTGSVLSSYAANHVMRVLIAAAITGKIHDTWPLISDFSTSWLRVFPIFGHALELAIKEFIAEVTDTQVAYTGDPLQSFPVQILNVALKSPIDFASAMGNYVDGDTETAKKDMYRGTKKAFESGAMLYYGVPVYEGKRLTERFTSEEEEVTGRSRRSGQRRTRQSRQRRSGS